MKHSVIAAARRIVETAAPAKRGARGYHVLDHLDKYAVDPLFSSFDSTVITVKDALKELTTELSDIKSGVRPSKDDDEATKNAFRIVMPIFKESSAEIQAAVKALLSALAKSNKAIDKANKDWYKQSKDSLHRQP